MATLYYNAAGDNNWDTLSNWWQNSSWTTPAVATPVDGDTVYIDGELDSGPNTADVTLVNIIIGSLNISSFNVTLNGSNQAIGPVQVYSNDTLLGVVQGDTTFNSGGNIDPACVINGNVLVNTENMAVQGTINGNLTINSTSGTPSYLNGATVIGNAIFNGTTGSNDGIIEGDITCNGTSQANGITINGNATFNDSSQLASGATVGGNATFNDDSSTYGGGTISGTVTLRGTTGIESFLTQYVPSMTFVVQPQLGINGSSILGLV